MISPEMWQHIPEVTTIIGTLFLLMAFTKSQREAIIERDEGKCQFPEKHECDPEHLQVHHLVPQRYCKEVGIENPDFSLNGLSVCKNAHVGELSPGVPGLHPDVIETKKKYKQDKNAFREMFNDRAKKLKNREPYWNTKWDRLLHVITIRNHQRAEKKGWVFPERRQKKSTQEPELGDNSSTSMKPLEVEMVES